MTDIDRALALDPCSEAREWMLAQPGSAYDMWRRCDRGDWLLWLAARAGVGRRLVVLAACDCAETALVHVPSGEERPRIAIETARRWARGGATLVEVRYAAYAAYYANAGGNAAYHAAAAAYAYGGDADYAALASANAAYACAARAAANAADVADAAVARGRSLAASARLVRARIPWNFVRDALRGES